MSPNNPTTIAPKFSRKRTIKSVQFSSSVSLRCYRPSSSITYAPHQHQIPSLSYYSPWLSVQQVREMKTRAKILAKHFRIREERRRLNGEVKKLASCHPSQYEIVGESLRGMEHMTDIEKGRERQCVKTKAFDAVERMQKDTGSSNSAASCGRSAIIKVNAMRRKVAMAYEENAREALMFSIRLAEEDAKVAAAILAEDLASSTGPLHATATSHPTPVPSVSCESSCDSPTSVKNIFSLNQLFQPKANGSQCVVESSLCPVPLPVLGAQRNIQHGVPNDLQLLVAIALNSRGINARGA